MLEPLTLSVIFFGSVLLFIGSMILQPQNSKNVDTFVMFKEGLVIGLISAAIQFSIIWGITKLF